VKFYSKHVTFENFNKILRCTNFNFGLNIYLFIVGLRYCRIWILFGWSFHGWVLKKKNYIEGELLKILRHWNIWNHLTFF